MSAFNYAPVIKFELLSEIETLEFLDEKVTLHFNHFIPDKLKACKEALCLIGDEPVYKLEDLKVPSGTMCAEALIHSVFGKPVSELQYLESDEAMCVKLIGDCEALKNQIKGNKAQLEKISSADSFHYKALVAEYIHMNEEVYKYVLFPRLDRLMA